MHILPSLLLHILQFLLLLRMGFFSVTAGYEECYLSLYVDLVSWPECLGMSFSSLSFVGKQSHCLQISLPFPVTWDSWVTGL